MTPRVEIAVAGRARVGEGPVWDETRGTLHWVDILGGEVHTWAPATGEHDIVTVPTLVGAAAPRTGGGVVAAVTEGFATVRDSVLDIRRPVLSAGVRMNDAKVDSRGRFWAGSCAMDFAAGRGALHVLHGDWSVDVVLDGLTQPNGLGWSPDDRTFYLIDSAEQLLIAFDFDATTGRLGGRHDLIRYAGDDVPDGMTVDAAGGLWIAMWGGGRVEHRAASGELLDTIDLPVTQPTSCAVAGDRDLLYVTSAAEGRSGDGPDGSVLAVRGLGVRGLPATPFGG